MNEESNIITRKCNNNDEPFLSPPPTTAVDKLLSSRKSHHAKSASSLSALPSKVSTISKKRRLNSSHDQRLKDISTSLNYTPGQKRRGITYPQSSKKAQIVNVATPYNPNKQPTNIKTATLLNNRYSPSRLKNNSSGGKILFPMSMLFNENVQSSKLNDTCNQKSFGLLSFETLVRSSSTTKTNNVCNANLIAQQIVILDSSIDKSVRPWQFQTHHDTILPKDEYDMLCKTVSTTQHEQDVTTTTTNNNNYQYRVVVEENLHLNAQTHQQTPHHLTLSLPTLNIMLSTMNAGVLVYDQDYGDVTSNEHDKITCWWMLFPHSISSSVLIPLPFVSLSPPNPSGWPTTSVSQPITLTKPKNKTKVAKITPMKDETIPSMNIDVEDVNNANSSVRKETTSNERPSSHRTENSLQKTEHQEPNHIFDSSDYKSKWNEVIKEYQNCLYSASQHDSNDTAASSDSHMNPSYSFIKDNLYPCLYRIILSAFKSNQDIEDEVGKKNVLSILLREASLLDVSSNGHNLTEEKHDGADITILMTKAEMMSCIMARKVNSNNSEVPSNGDKLNTDTKNVPDQKQEENSFYQRLFEMQIYLRMELFQLLYGKEYTQINGLFSLEQIHVQDLCAQYGAMIGKKKSKRMKEKKSIEKKAFSSKDFRKEVCSIIELMPFVMPSTVSFTDYVKTCIAKPYHSSDIIEGILDHFEIDVEDDKSDESDSESYSKVLKATIGGDSESEYFVEQSNTKTHTVTSRWDKVMSDSSTNFAGETVKDEDASSSPGKKLPNKDILCKQEIKIQPNSTNPLLANSRGRYIGRSLSTNFFDQVHVVSSIDTKQQNRKRSVEAPSETKAVIKRSESNQSSVGPLHLKPSLVASRVPTNLGSATHMTNRTIQPTIGHNKSSKQNEAKNAKQVHYGAAALAARAGLAMRKKAKS